jgi:acetyl-CoA C-acetyltransferase
MLGIHFLPYQDIPMTPQPHRKLPDNTPIIIGVGQCVERLQPRAIPPFKAPMQLAATACQAALQDAGIPAQEIDTIAVIRLFSDTVNIWASPLGGSDNPPESVARRIGAVPTHRIYSNASGTEPLHLMAELAGAIARGEKKIALLTGAEAIASQRFAQRNALVDDWREEFDTPFENRKDLDRLVSMEEVQGGLTLPVRSYAIIENSQAHRMGHDRQQHQRFMTQLMAPFSAVAAANPYAQFQTAYSADELAAPGPNNYPISLPYTKLLIAQDAVNQASALILTSVGHARRLGVDPQQWIFLESYAEGADKHLSEREDPGRSAAMERVLSTAMDSAGASHEDMDLIDIYSCFPCAVTAACDVLGLPTDGSRALTVTGGLPYFGGPGNNYSAHALAEMAVRLRGAPSRALVTANGGILSKHAAAVLTTDAARATNTDWTRSDKLTLDCSDIPVRPIAKNAQRGTVISFTVVARRDKDDIAVVLAETAGGERFLASNTELAVTGPMQANSPIGRDIDVHVDQDRQLFSFHQA